MFELKSVVFVCVDFSRALSPHLRMLHDSSFFSLDMSFWVHTQEEGDEHQQQQQQQQQAAMLLLPPAACSSPYLSSSFAASPIPAQ